MANPSKQKGTGGETELVRLLAELGLEFVRMPASADYDLTNANPNRLELTPLEALATRPDRGEWLVTLRLEDFAHLLKLTQTFGPPWETHIEAKRYTRFALHTIWNNKFGRKK
jgi:Holliday junction resolvase